MKILIIINTILLVYLLIKSFSNDYYICIYRNKTSYLKILYGINISLMKKTSYGATNIYTFYIPLKNYYKCKVKDNLYNLMKPNNSNKDNTLRAMFSWIKTKEDAVQFQKDYSIVNKELVKYLVSKLQVK